ncbi:MAG: VWA domain-containing protein [Acidobacteria bacterium]|nr:VWA domain-containing protein [Acidobacteriota bacterium]
MHLQNPEFLLLLPLIPLVIWRYIKLQRSRLRGLQFSSAMALEGVRPSWTVHARHVLFVSNTVALALTITALARPQKGTEIEEVLTEGIDIIMALDASGSMAAEDFEPHNRFFVAKSVISTFIEGLRHDRAGLVVFAGKALTRCPPTLDYGALRNVLEETRLGEIEDGTAIGNALACCLNRLRVSTAKSKVVILVTDGVNNRGEIQPADAALMAQLLGARIYTVGIGSSGTARFPIQDPVYGRTYVDMQVEIDEESLRNIAESTGGIYYRATDRPSLEKIFAEIGRLETTEIRSRVHRRYSERFHYFLLPALGLVLLGTLTGYSRFSRIP